MLLNKVVLVDGGARHKVVCEIVGEVEENESRRRI